MASRLNSRDTSRRQRRYASKAKTGCTTCRQRRIKCGEERPHCQRCLSSGRLCDGYADNFRLASSNVRPDDQVVISWTRPPSQAPNVDSVEQEAIYYFRESVLGCACSTWDVGIWRRLVLPMSAMDPAIRHGLAALSALMQAGRSDRSFALRQYGLAMNDLQTKIASTDGKLDHCTVLVACVVFVAIEFLLNTREQAIFHLNGGLSVINELRRETGIYYGVSAGTSDIARLEQLFHRLDNQLLLYSSSRVRLARASDGACMPCLPAQHHLKTIEKAGELHQLQVSAMRELVYEVNVRRFAPSDTSITEHVELEVQQARQLASLDQWHAAAEKLMPTLVSAPDVRLAKQLMISYYCCRVMVAHALDEGRELSYDADIPTFRRILELATDVQHPSAESHPCAAARRFSLDIGVIAPLYFTILKCREPTLRRGALALLRSSKSQEGAWDSSRMAALGELIVSVEEADVKRPPQSAAEVPEKSRLWRAYYDSEAPGRLFCKRRLWEQDGRWAEYSVRVD